MGEQFDDWSKALASGMSRRRALMVIVAGIVGGAGAILGSGPSLAKSCQPPFSRCGKLCCSRCERCIPVNGEPTCVFIC